MVTRRMFLGDTLAVSALAATAKGAVEDARANGDQNAYYLSLSDAKTLGSRMHPSRDAHRQAAKEIVDELKKLLSLE